LPNVHYLKIHTQHFQGIRSGIEKLQVRKNDIEVGDTLILDEFDPIKKRYTGAWMPKLVTSIDDPQFMKEGCVVLGTVDIKF
jgi:hypothetical protein